MTKAYISVGSNIFPENNIRSALAALGKVFGAIEVSPVYQSPAQGFEGADFLNLVVCVDSHLSPQRTQQTLWEIENNLGRDRSGAKFSDRTIDLDLLLLGNEVVSEDDLEIPRPEIEQFAHVLVPLTDLAADLPHPLSGRRMVEMYREMMERDPAQFSALKEIIFAF